MNFSNVKVTVIGDIMLDIYISGKCTRVSPEAPVPVVVVENTSYFLGGAANVALNLVRLGCQVDLFGVTGKDAYGKILADLWRDGEDIPNNNRMLVLEEAPTTVKTRIIANGQQVVRFDQEGSFSWFRGMAEEVFLDIVHDSIESSNAVILSDYNKGVLSTEMAEDLVAFCSRNNVPCFVDPKDGWDKFIGAFCIKPNEYELQRNVSALYSGSLEAKLRGICSALNIDYLLLTRGKDGMVLASYKDIEVIPVRAKEVFDVSGAGDTAIATLAAAYGSGLSMKEAAILSNIAAGIVVGKKGTQPITIEELNESSSAYIIE